MNIERRGPATVCDRVTALYSYFVEVQVLFNFT